MIEAKSTTTSTQHILPHTSGRWYTEDEINNRIADEYNKFKESLQKSYKEKFDKNFATAQQACEKVYLFLRTKDGIMCNKVHLRFTSFDTFEALIEIPEKDYLSDNFDKAYLTAKAVSDLYNNEKFNVEFSFMSSSKKIGAMALISDGFIKTYKRVNVKKATSRTT